MSFFKQKEKPEICGYLDNKGRFYKNRIDRDKSNSLIEKDNLRKTFEHKLSDERKHYFGNHPQLYNQILDELIRYGAIERITEAYIIYQKQLKEIDEKYNSWN